MVRAILRLEGLAVLLASVWAYAQTGSPWLLFVMLILAPDLSMVGYLRSTRLGAITYNLVHNYVVSLTVIGIGLLTGAPAVLGIGLILAAHVGMDRAMLFGLKYPTGFKRTHMNLV